MRGVFSRERRPTLIARVKNGTPELNAEWELKCELAWPGKRRWDLVGWVVLVISGALVAAGLVIIYQAELEETLAPLFVWIPALVVLGSWMWFYDRKKAKTWAAQLPAGPHDQDA